MSCQAAKRALPVLLCLISTCDCFLSSHGLMRAVFRAPSCGRRSHLAPIRGLRAQAAGEEWELTNEQCDLLQLPRGTKMVGEMSESMEARLSTMGTYEESNPIRYFGNEKFRKENYFGKKKLEVNANRMAAKVRRAEIEERSRAGPRHLRRAQQPPPQQRPRSRLNRDRPASASPGWTRATPTTRPYARSTESSRFRRAWARRTPRPAAGPGC
jgi:hypothetical protein